MAARSPPKARPPKPGHLCGWTGCHRRVHLGFWGCNGHWNALPCEVRAAILRGYQRGRLSEEWREAHKKALAYIAGGKERMRSLNMRGTGIDQPIYKPPKRGTRTC